MKPQTKLSMHLYKGYELTAHLGADGKSLVDVFDPRYPQDSSLYRTTSLDRAMRWVDAYRNGAVWATQEMSKAR
jgi:hypothetical protein